MQQIVLASRPTGTPVAENFRLEEHTNPEPGPDEMLVEVIWLSLDPYMRGRMDDAKSYAKPVAIGQAMEGRGVARVTKSNLPAFSEGDFVLGGFGWVSHAVSNGEGITKLDPAIAPISTAVGVLGMPGLTAYVGLNDHGQPKAGQTLVVSAATGAVGSLVGQLGKIHGMRVVGVAGGAAKCQYAIEKLGYDACIDHHACADAQELSALLAKECPDGIDIYYENVGGKTLLATVPLMNVHGRICLCGMISWYDLGGLGMGLVDAPNDLPKVWRTILVNRLNVRGFIITDHYDRFSDFTKEVSSYIRDGRVIYHETIANGLASAPEAFIGLLKGDNLGKQLVKVTDDPS